MASNENFSDPPPRYETLMAGYNFNSRQPRGCPPAFSLSAQLNRNNSPVVTRPGSSAVPSGTYSYMQYPALVICRYCTATVTTSLEYKNSSKTWIIAGVLCLCGCWFGCCLIPFFVDSIKDVVHRCPNCLAAVGKYINH